MNILEQLILSLGLAMDAFAVSISLGLSMKKLTVKKAFVVGLYFGIFQAAMPLLGCLVASLFASQIEAYDHWIALALLVFLGVKMIIGSFKDGGNCEHEEKSLGPKVMLPYAIATSIDALAVGVTFAFLKVEVFSAVALVGAVTFGLCLLGVKLGSLFGAKSKSKAEIFGGVVLILIGLKIVLEHLGIICF